MSRKINTAERYYGFGAKVMATAAAVELGALLLCTWAADIPFVTGLYFLIPTVGLLLPFELYFLAEYFYYHGAELESRGEAVLERTDTNRFGLSGFVVRIHVYDTELPVTTKHVFVQAPRWKLAANRLDDYVGSTREIGYDPKRNEYIVI